MNSDEFGMNSVGMTTKLDWTRRRNGFTGAGLKTRSICHNRRMSSVANKNFRGLGFVYVVIAKLFLRLCL